MVKSLWIAGMSVLEPSQNDWLERYDHISSFVPELGAAGLCVDVVRNVQSLHVDVHEIRKSLLPH